MAEIKSVFNLRGLVLRTTDVGDRNRMLTILTAEEGRLSVYARGVRKLSGENLPSVQMFAYADFTLARRGDRWYLREASIRETFLGLSSSIEGAALAAYFCEAAEELSFPGGEAGDLLQLTLNALWTIAAGKKPLALIKGAFELRASAIAGFMPDIRACCVCGTDSPAKETGEAADAMLDIMNGRLLCRSCFQQLYPAALTPPDPRAPLPVDETGQAVLFRRVPPGTLAAMRYILGTPAKRQFSFAVPPEELPFFQDVCETYLVSHTEHGFRTLRYYKTVSSFTL